MSPALVLIGFSLLLSTGCKLSEQVTAPPGELTVVAQMVLNTAVPVQKLTLEYSRGGTSLSYLTGATAQLTHLSPDPSCARPAVTLAEAIDSTVYGGAVEARRVYQTRDLCALHPGDSVALRIETALGDVVTGTTVIPGANQTLVKAGSVTALTPSLLSLDRTRDSVQVAIDPRFARGLEIEVVRKGGNPRSRTITRTLPTRTIFDVTTDSMHAAIAGSLLDPFADEDERTVFHAGADYLFSFATVDANYFDFVRSGANPFTGRGFINHLAGGIGVFGSVAPVIHEVRVTAPQRDPREGVYRIFGPLTQLGGRSVDLQLDVYLDAAGDPGDFSALTEGTWVEGPLYSSADGGFTGGFDARFYGTPKGPFGTRTLYEMDYNGSLPRRGTPFTATLATTLRNSTTFDKVTVVQLSGP